MTKLEILTMSVIGGFGTGIGVGIVYILYELSRLSIYWIMYGHI